MPGFVSCEILLDGEGLVTLITLVRKRVRAIFPVERRMSPQMHQVVMLDDKRLPTSLANVGTRNPVSFSVLVQIIFAREAFATHLAVVHFLSGVRDGVPHQVFLAAESFGTGRTNVRSLPGVELPMLKQVFFPFERFATNVAIEKVGVVLNGILLGDV